VITGVSDHKGDAEKNRELSLKRADAVVAELVSLGLDVTGIETAAVVENVANVPRSQQWKARRVDVALKPAGEAAPVTAP
jgi:outer membrane protein OmpA-like peptidoglycan-associated protein